MKPITVHYSIIIQTYDIDFPEVEVICKTKADTCKRIAYLNNEKQMFTVDKVRTYPVHDSIDAWAMATYYDTIYRTRA